MILVLFLFALVILFMTLIIFIFISTIKVEIIDFELSNVKHIDPNYKINISLLLFNKLKWLSLRFNDNKIRKMYTKMHLEKIDIKKLEKNLKLSDIKEIAKIKPQISYMKLIMNIGVEDVILTSYLIPIICTILSIILPYVTEVRDINNINYKIVPIYNNKNIYHIKLNTNIEIKIINILNSVYHIYKSKKYIKKENKIRCNV